MLSMSVRTSDSGQARSFTKPETAIQACYITQKRHLLKPAMSTVV